MFHQVKKQCFRCWTGIPLVPIPSLTLFLHASLSHLNIKRICSGGEGHNRFLPPFETQWTYLNCTKNAPLINYIYKKKKKSIFSVMYPLLLKRNPVSAPGALDAPHHLKIPHQFLISFHFGGLRFNINYRVWLTEDILDSRGGKRWVWKRISTAT